MALPFEEVCAAIRSRGPAAVYVLAGADGWQHRAVLSALRERVPEIGHVQMQGGRVSAGDIVAALRTVGLLPGRLVVVDDPPWILASRRSAAAEGADAGEEEASDEPADGADADERPLLRYIDAPSPGAVLVLRTTGTVDRRRRLARHAAERGVQVLAEAPRDGTPWLRARCGDRGLALPPALFEAVAARLHGATCERMANEVEKLLAYGGVDAEALDRLLPPGREERVFDLLDAAVAPGGPALALAAALLEQGEPVQLLLFLLAKQLRTIIQVAAACAGGAHPEAVAPRLGLHPFVARKALDQSRRIAADALAEAHAAVWRAELDMKTGRRFPPDALDAALLGMLRAFRGAA